MRLTYAWQMRDIVSRATSTWRGACSASTDSKTGHRSGKESRVSSSPKPFLAMAACNMSAAMAGSLCLRAAIAAALKSPRPSSDCAACKPFSRPSKVALVLSDPATT
eukprot:CAMPEP_0202339842 /NCGR_PEP_ID=MMETSP1126-20121109/1531_1 /ASSEMBLY_ACC=CAM_ASM_000457 /TAXON_ID=3047 /ORGANISM="Dunaliella tertiolecta, Strain CCMP1320" /LENGTH=106 /DNA_ID=CAMNT_0048930451 /DNA_START=712 /DNA_END=1032 /DNA_ORIENTATION=-